MKITFDFDKLAEELSIVLGETNEYVYQYILKNDGIYEHRMYYFDKSKEDILILKAESD